MISKRFATFVLGAIFVFVPVLVFAADGVFSGQIWPAEQCNCPNGFPGFGCVVLVIHNLMNLAIALGAGFAIMRFLYAGYLFTINGFFGDKSAAKVKEANDLMVRTVWGICIVLGAYGAIDFVLKAVYNDNAWSSIGIESREWNQLLNPSDENQYCIAPRTLTTPNGTTPTAPSNPSDPSDPSDSADSDSCPVANCGGTSCRDLSADCGFNTTSIGDSTFNVVPSLETKLREFDAAYGGSWTITSAYDPTGHTNDCHRNGTCVDIDFVGNQSPNGAQVNEMISALTSAGLHPCWEVGSESTRSSYINQGVNGQYIDAISGIGTSWHFSVYMSAPSGGTCSR